MTGGGERFRSILENRHDVLGVLVEEPATKPALVEILDVSRSTVNRAIRDLQSVECITRTDDGYVATMTGRISLAEYDEYCDRTRSIQAAQPFLHVLPVDAPMDTAMLRGASVSMPNDHAPEEALKPTIDLLEQATEMRGLAPVVLSFYPDLLEQQVREQDVTMEIVAEEAVLAMLPNMMSTRVEPFMNHENVTLYESSDSLPYALWFMETPEGTTVGITAYVSGGVAGVLVNDSEAAVRWAAALYEQYREDARPVSPSGH